MAVTGIAITRKTTSSLINNDSALGLWRGENGNLVSCVDAIGDMEDDLAQQRYQLQNYT